MIQSGAGFYIIRKEVVGALLVGGAISYFITKRWMIAKYKDKIDRELAEARLQYHKNLLKQKAQKVNVSLADVYGHDLTDEQLKEAHRTYKETVRDPELEEIIEDEEWNYEEELKSRTPDKPYIIQADEFIHDEPDYSKISLTYYEKDDILVEDGAHQFESLIGVVGDEVLQQFGHGSNDENMLYVRSEALECDWEITKTDGDYSAEVLGYIEHAEKPRKVHKFRREEE